MVKQRIAIVGLGLIGGSLAQLVVLLVEDRFAWTVTIVLNFERDQHRWCVRWPRSPTQTGSAVSRS